MAETKTSEDVAEVYCLKTQDRPGPDTWQVALSSTIWSAAITAPFYDELGLGETLTVFMPIWVLAILTFFVQSSYALSVHWIVAESENVCEEPSLLTLMCVGVLTMSAIAGDFMDSIRSYLWLQEFPTGGTLGASIKLVQKKYKDRFGGPTVLWRPKGAIPFWYRSVCLLCFIILRAGVVAAIAVIGAGHIVRSETDEDRILNTVALLFIVDLDDVVHSLFTPPYIQNALSGMPPIELVIEIEAYKDEPAVPFIGPVLYAANVLRIWIMVIFWGLSTTVLTYSWCEENQGAILSGVGGTLALLTCCWCSCMVAYGGKKVLAGRSSEAGGTPSREGGRE